MSDHDTSPIDLQRRAMLQVAAGLTATVAPAAASAAAAAAPVDPPAPTGKPGDFDFLSGQWKIRHRRLKDGAWDHFEGEATVHGILGGVASVEELRIPARGFSGMGLRLLDLERKLWADYWVNAQSGVLTPPPSWGSFVGGAGTWDSVDDTDSTKPVIWRGVWDQITERSCRWFQANSRDQGRTWQETWVMQWQRA